MLHGASAGARRRPAAAAVRSDFDGDGKADVLWRNESTGRNRVWLMNGAALAAEDGIGREIDRYWKVQAAVDFTGDGKADILWRHALSGDNRLWVMNTFALTSTARCPRRATRTGAWPARPTSPATARPTSSGGTKRRAKTRCGRSSGGVAGAPLAVTDARRAGLARGGRGRLQRRRPGRHPVAARHHAARTGSGS